MLYYTEYEVAIQIAAYVAKLNEKDSEITTLKSQILALENTIAGLGKADLVKSLDEAQKALAAEIAKRSAAAEALDTKP